jgi:electron transfer flavoprotein beta subunit
LDFVKNPILLSFGIFKSSHINMNGLKIIVLAKQVPDTRNVGKDAMKEDGTVNRQALPAIFNPEDLNALELALRIKDEHAGSTVSLLTMGPVRAADIIREGLFRGADNGYLLSDRAFAGSDTLATSYALSCAIRTIGEFDLIVCGRQAIDGDTAQVGPQVAEKLGIPQITYAEEIVGIENGKITVKRRLERGVEIVEGPLPMLVTVNSSAPDCRPRNVKLMMKYKHAKSASELKDASDGDKILLNERSFLNINEMGVRDIDARIEDLGLSGSPTKVKKIENVVFQAKDTKRLTASDGDISDLMVELITNHTLG